MNQQTVYYALWNDSWDNLLLDHISTNRQETLDRATETGKTPVELHGLDMEAINAEPPTASEGVAVTKMPPMNITLNVIR